MEALVLKISGKVKESNFPEFKNNALAMIKAADKPLVSDQDFADAEQTVKKFKKAEDAIKKAKTESLKEVADINKLFESLDEVSEALRTTRLSLNKKVVCEKKERKQQIINCGCEEFNRALNDIAKDVPEIHNAIVVRKNLFEDAVSGKRKIESMEAAVNALLEFELRQLDDAKGLIIHNKGLIKKCEFQSLFPDSAHIVYKKSSEVQSIIEGRVAAHKLQEKERLEKEAAAKEERERKELESTNNKGRSPRYAPECSLNTTTGEQNEPTQHEPPEPEPARSSSSSGNTGSVLSGGPSDKSYKVTVLLDCGRDRAVEVAEEIHGLVIDIDGVSTVKVEEV